ncbi:DUF3145 domain-containing protein [Paramicrobacterium agarici]|uniref:Uncharacterized protein DUF3145 n=1 Tax=Paramicrobacterium agarici TaxID=630514 RepID=A0A2A9DXY8_9MICO|nr:DUF3145 domain-containing protein [Microbacterium agarici]PFG31236.1 uncharacterized protein DUF3145 [Microbacterium agarici]TQO24338.1 uncharacterized protein DUF3145 [Microbacterium agarici]
MTTPAARGVIYIHSSPRALCPHVEWAAGRALCRAVNFNWTDQPVLPGSQRTEFYWEGSQGMGAAISSALRGWEHLRYEVTEDATPGSDGGRWMHTPDLGIFYAQLDTAGNTVVPEDRIRAVMESSHGSADALVEGLGVALGQAWDDELDVFRHASDTAPVVWLHKVG